MAENLANTELNFSQERSLMYIGSIPTVVSATTDREAKVYIIFIH